MESVANGQDAVGRDTVIYRRHSMAVQVPMMIHEKLTDEHLESIVRAIVAVRQPSAVILFGSYARGDVHQFSDVDLLVIRRNEFQTGESRRKELGLMYRAVSEICSTPKDIILYTPDEFFAWRNTTNHMAAVAWKEGRILHGQI
jgi:uncharacterized protein